MKMGKDQFLRINRGAEFDNAVGTLPGHLLRLPLTKWKSCYGFFSADMNESSRSI
jgi:hypothetical protein